MDAVDMIIETEKWFSGKTEQLQMIVDSDKNQKIMIQSDNGERIELPEEHRKGFIYGITLALEVMGKFPVKITKDEEKGQG